MNRTMILIVALTGALGLTLGWLAPGSRTLPAAPHSHEVRKPPMAEAVAPARPSGPGRLEFPLRPEDIANDRETPAVAVDAEGRAVVAWAAQSGDNDRTIYLARSADGGKTFDPPSPFHKVPIYRFTSQGKGKGKAMAYSTHVLPRLVAAADGLYLGWVEAVNGGPEVIEYVARSADGGQTFSVPVPVHGQRASRPGFTALSVAPDGTLLAAWLDGRDGGQQPFHAARPVGSEGFEPERKVFAGPEGKGICPCCDLAAVRLPDGSDLVAFRNIDAGHRDIWFARAPRGGLFGSPSPLCLDQWSFEGCPHDGPSLVLDRDRLYAAWMSGHTGRNRVYVAGSPASDLAFQAHELNPNAPGAQGHPRLATARPDQVVAVWDESLDDSGPSTAAETTHGAAHGHSPALTGSGRAVMLAVGNDRGFGPASPVAPRPGAFQLNPSLAVGADGAVLVVWNEIDADGKRVVFVRRESSRDGSR
jgi:hypothetical protein